MIQIKEFSSTDAEFKDITRIFNLVSHDYVVHYKDDKDEWNIREKDLLTARLLLYRNNTLIGYIAYEQGKKENQRTVFFTIKIDPAYIKKKYIDILFKEMLRRIKTINCNKILTEVYEHPNYSDFQKYLINEQFVLAQKNREYNCEIQKIDLKPYQSLIKKLGLAGIQFFESKNDIKNKSDHYRKLEKLEWSIDQDIPIPKGIKWTRDSFDRFLEKKKFFEQKCYGTEIIAVKDGKYIGMTSLTVFKRSEPNKAFTETLGVLKNYRRQGIATALKIKAIETLIIKGIKEIRTDNEINNPMYKINEKLGFYAVPSSLEYLKTID